MTDPVLSIQDLSVFLSRDGRSNLVLDGIGFAAAAGEVIALVGESGAGKSTLGLALQGLLPREGQPRVTGSIRIAGFEVVGAGGRALRVARRNLVRAIPQDAIGALNPTMTIRRQMRESAGGDDESTMQWLQRTGLRDAERIADAFPHRLSGGQRQRVLIAMSMMAQPKLLIADELTTALDMTTQAKILDLLRRLVREQQTTVLLITHDLSVAAALADRVVVLYAGRIGEIGAMRDVMRNPAHPYSAGLLEARFDFDSDRSRPLPTLPLEADRTADAWTACAYAKRCPLAEADCRAGVPSLRPATRHAGQVACLHDERTPTVSQTRTAGGRWTAGRIEKGVLALTMSNVSKSFPTGPRTFWGRRRPQPVLRSVDLAISQGECVALVGESGSGKSTLLRIAAGLLAPDSGNVARSEDRQPQIVFQDAVSTLTPWLTIGEQIGERLRPLGVRGSKRRRLVAESLELVGLEPALMDARASELSGGQCQRAVLARAVVVPPSVLLCDEPTTALDVSLAATTLNLLGELRRRLGIAMLFVTHDLAAARIIADRIAVLHDGELVEDGDPDALIAAPQARYTRSLIAAMPTLRVELAK